MQRIWRGKPRRPAKPRVIQELLDKIGIHVAIAQNGREAVKMVSRELFDGVLMDLQMPVIDGFDATRKIRQNPKFADLPILAMTANVMSGDREN